MDSALRLNVPVDASIMQRALAEIIRRHEALRAAFRKVDGRPVQVTLREKLQQSLQADISLIDLFQFPTIGALARHLDRPAITPTSSATGTTGGSR